VHTPSIDQGERHERERAGLRDRLGGEACLGKRREDLTLRLEVAEAATGRQLNWLLLKPMPD